MIKISVGTWLIKGDEKTLKVMDMALEAGYRLFGIPTISFF